MPVFGKKSAIALKTLHPRLQVVLESVIRFFDFTIVEGVRDIEAQRTYVEKGVSKTLNSKHLKQPDGYAHAADVAPYPVDWRDNSKSKARFYFLQGMIYATACLMGIKVRQGLDWDGDNDYFDQNFDDLPHVELDD